MVIVKPASSALGYGEEVDEWVGYRRLKPHSQSLPVVVQRLPRPDRIPLLETRIRTPRIENAFLQRKRS
jgi:hypothetical protein